MENSARLCLLGKVAELEPEAQNLKALFSKFVQAITFVACIMEVPCSNVGRDIDHPDRCTSSFPSVASGKS
jgi:hypothetical protein